MNDTQLIILLQEFVKESKDASLANTEEHKEVVNCINKVKLQVNSIESLCKNSEAIRETCYKKQDDVELRLREIEKFKPLKRLHDKIDRLAFKVYSIVGAMTLIMIIAGWMIKNSGA